eukprot:TRINITY_DN12743_c0_g1_i1.p1 TRINITY_DN12743_c0_g1~~TRINITY_DN12743_c0_g1_i1.p1  ORF type:complete len:491 (+),score=55.56 TRINITY_DN12743_c0_g1_i1:32-1504(+)
MKSFVTTLLVSALVLLVSTIVNGDPIDDYMNLPDPVFNWTQTTVIKKDTHKIYNIFLTSQTWLNSSDSSQPIWNHWLQVCVPDVILTNIGLLYIDGGSDGSINLPPQKPDFEIVEQICTLTGAVSTNLAQVPNEPITFPADPLHMVRTEDEIIAYTWAYYMNNTKAANITQWVLQFPMAKAASVALTAIQQFVKKERDFSIPTFVVGGASKRGWDTWLTAAVDRRVIAIVPIVAPVGNVTATINQMWQSYGEWTFAFEPYCQEGVPGQLNHPDWFDLVALIDPVVFRDRLTMPKYVICATGDEFFMPQSPLFFWNDLRGEKYLRMVPNAEHSMAGHAEDVMYSVVQFMEAIIHSNPIPNYDWQISADGTTITVTTNAKPKKVVMWHALNPHKRDFRMIVCGINDDPLCIGKTFWLPEELQPVSVENGIYTYSSTQNIPDKGWLGFLVEAHYDMGFESDIDPLKITSGVSIIPQTYPYEGCGLNCTNYCPP